MGARGWEDLELTLRPGDPGRFDARIPDRWMLAVVPQRGIWDPTDRSLVASATQLMFFTFASR